MDLRTLDYQQRVLGRLDDYLDELVTQKKKTNKIKQANAQETDPDLIRALPDFSKATWEALQKRKLLPSFRDRIPHSERRDAIGRPVPNILYKVPTAGGKTYLAVASLPRIFHKYLNRITGFVLWIVPNEVIYTQTKRVLTDRHSPYRQLLDNLSGNAVKIMDKNTPLHTQDVARHLCIMLLMLQSSTRKNNRPLKVFQERGDVHGFSPEEGDAHAHLEAKRAIPNLDMCDLANSSYPWMPVKDSLGNALRIIRPIVVMDEGHKAVSNLAFKTLYDFNPIFVLELTATPKDVSKKRGKNPHPARYQNILVSISGTELNEEEMIKMPLNLYSHQDSTDWRSTLSSALERLNTLRDKAKTLHDQTNRYIRPIMLVQVERTGKKQRDKPLIHTEDVREWLTHTGRVDAAEIAIKSASQNEFTAPENQNLLEPANRIRVIITKSALQEGWDCPFAYVLCSLSASSSLSAMTQLAGRILRQPHAQKTEVTALDECYVIAHHANTATVIARIKQGLEEGGMGDLVQEVHPQESDPSTYDHAPHIIKRNPNIGNKPIFLPKVLRVVDRTYRELDYEEDILYPLDWLGWLDGRGNTEIENFVDSFPGDQSSAESQQFRIGLKGSDPEHPMSTDIVDKTPETNAFDPAYVSQALSDIVSNAWVARAIVERVIIGITKKHALESERLGQLSSYIIESLQRKTTEWRDTMAEELFRRELKHRRICFHLQAKGVYWQMPHEITPSHEEGAKQLRHEGEVELQLSLFRPLYEDDFNNDERNIALYMDSKETLEWWHRNIARQHYYLQGWRREKVYPDFICAVKREASGPKLVVLEMKGAHLKGNDDTEYKRELLKLISESRLISESSPLGDNLLIGERNNAEKSELEIHENTPVYCELVEIDDWKERLPELLQP